MKEEGAFGKELARLRTTLNLSQADLADYLNYPRSTIVDWEIGKTIPRQDEILNLAKAASLGKNYTNYLLELAGYNLVSATVSDHPAISESPAYPESLREIQVQVKDIRDSIKVLSSKLEEKAVTGHDEISSAISEELQNAMDAVSRLQTTSREITAPVTLPSSDDLTVSLVPSSVLERLEEYRSEESKWLSGLGIFIGAMLGIFINVATGGSMSAQAWIILAVLLVMVCFTGWSAWTYRQRGNKLKEQLLTRKQNQKPVSKNI
jgi:transcriptional regulator with XRE-family HTH domain